MTSGDRHRHRCSTSSSRDSPRASAPLSEDGRCCRRLPVACRTTGCSATVERAALAARTALANATGGRTFTIGEVGRRQRMPKPPRRQRQDPLVPSLRTTTRLRAASLARRLPQHHNSPPSAGHGAPLSHASSGIRRTRFSCTRSLARGSWLLWVAAQPSHSVPGSQIQNRRSMPRIGGARCAWAPAMQHAVARSRSQNRGVVPRQQPAVHGQETRQREQHNGRGWERSQPL